MVDTSCTPEMYCCQEVMLMGPLQMYTDNSAGRT